MAATEISYRASPFNMSKVAKSKVSNERKDLSRLAGEFLVASRLTQHGYMVALQWGTTIGYDILVFDKAHNVAYVEVKATASHSRKWFLQKKYATPSEDAISADKHFICCVDLTPGNQPISTSFLKGLHYFYSSRFSRSPSYVLALDSKPRGHALDKNCLALGEHIQCEKYLGRFEALGVLPVVR
jgi:hypothetical protein